jgi:2-dehydro-3-deoxyglucarate aldolase
VGSWVNTASPIVAELMAAAGFDFLAVDVEHSPVDLAAAAGLFRAIRSGNADCEAFVRLPGCDHDTIKRYCDAGATGVIAPLVNTPDQARQVVRAVKYPPQGTRGVGFARCNQYGADFDRAVAAANDRTTVVVQIEHIQAVENIDAILAVEGIDATFIGPYDLSASMGLTGQTDHPDVLAAMDRILAACQDRGLAGGLHVVAPDPEALIARAEAGFRLLAYSLDITMLNHLCRTGLDEIRRRLE